MHDHTTHTPQQKREVRLTVENTIKLDPKNPIPIQYGGDIFYAPTGNKKYLPFLGRQDNLPNLLLEARLTSTTQNACIATIAKSVIGNGLIAKDAEITNEKLLQWMKSVNNERQSFNEILEQITDGERTHGNQFIEVVRGTVDRTKFFKVYLHSLLYCRLGAPNAEDEVTNVLISKLFARKGTRTDRDLEKALDLPLWNDNLLDQKTVWKQNSDGTESTMLHFKNEVSGIDYYGMAASISGLRNQVVEGKLEQYDLDNLDNNMVLGGMLVFKSSMTQEEAHKNAKEILLSHLGEGKSGRWAVLSSESGIADVDVIPYNTQKEGSYLEKKKQVQADIILANGWAKEFCFSDSGAMGKGGDYLRSLWDLKEASLLKPLRKRLVDKVVIPIMKMYSEWMGDAEVAKMEFDFKPSMPFSYMADLNPETFTKVKEARAAAGYEPDEANGEKYLSQMKPSKDVQGKPADKEDPNNK